MAKIGIFLPCYNVQNSIPNVLGSFSDETQRSVAEVVAVDNCSQDKTLDILKGLQRQGGELGRRLVIIKNLQNYGLGGSQKIAYQYFLDHGFTHFMIIHGDGQGGGEDVARSFLKVLAENPNVDLAVASRFTQKSDTAGYNRMRVIGNLLFNFLTFLLTGQKMTDSGAAILLIRTDILKQYPFRHLTNSFQFNPELNVLFYATKGLKIVEIPLKWVDSSDKSNITALNYCWTLLKILLRYRWNKTFLRKSGWQLFHDQSQEILPQFQILKA
ncbi:MAG: glycosyltransferase [Candidatus Omnitrophota bacterium]|nr:glycosyltransferase [Candidatus Omnitrophota bacterium]